MVAEGDVWAGMIALARRAGARLLMIDGRFVPCGRALDRWSRPYVYRRIGRLFDVVAVGAREDYQVALPFVPEPRLHLTGPSKALECLERASHRDQLRGLYRKKLALTGNPVLVVGSPVAREADVVARIVQWFLRRYPDGEAVVAPRYVRKPKHIAAFVMNLAARGIPVRTARGPVQRDSDLGLRGPARTVLLKDAEDMGTLPEVYSVASVAVVGGTLADGRGHNMLEPIAVGVPVVCGPGLERWRGIGRTLSAAGALTHVAPTLIPGAIERLLEDRTIAREVCLRAERVLAALADKATANVSLALDLYAE